MMRCILYLTIHKYTVMKKILQLCLLFLPGMALAQNLSTDPAQWYDIKGTGGLLGGYSTVSSNNDELIDIFSSTYLYEVKSADDYAKGNFSSSPTFSTNRYKINALDYNNDGLVDFMHSASYNMGEGLTRNYKGEYVPVRLPVYTPEEYAGVVDADNLHKSDGLGSGMSIVGGGGSPRDYDTWSVIDVNADGLPDFVRDANGGYLLSSKQGHFIIHNSDEVAQYRDFNADGLMDNVSFNRQDLTTKLNLLNKDGSVTSKTLFSNVHIRGNIWSFDFDHDGDIDVIVPVDYQVSYYNEENREQTHTNGMSIVVLAENRGDGTFKIHEYAFDGKVNFRQCMDIDADGCYELIAIKEGTDSKDVICYKVKDNEIEDSPTVLFSGIYASSAVLAYDPYLLVADVELTGIPQIICYDQANWRKQKADISIARENTAPTQPDAPMFAYDAGSRLLKIRWNASSDKECSAADLSYALRIGTEDGKGDMFFAHARQDGTRRNLLDGNCGFATMRTIDVSSWPAGEYYIAVQAVDPGHRGSAFSNSVIFRKEEPAAEFILSHTRDEFGAGDTCRIVLRTPKETGCTYRWNLDGAEILSQTEEDADMYVTFRTGGRKTITLQTIAANGKASRVVAKTLDVAPASFTEANFGTYMPFVHASMDMDGDGTAELYGSGVSSSTFYQGDEDGKYAAVKKLWNTSLSSYKKGSPYIVDANYDGAPDVYFPSSSYNNYLLTNEGDMQMTISDLGVNENAFSFVDIDNDGAYEGLYIEQSIYENVDNGYASWQYVTESAKISGGKTCDYNKDGLIDFYAYQDDAIRVYINKGDYTFEEQVVPTEKEKSPTNVVLKDIDGDGKLDGIFDYTFSRYTSHSYSDSISVDWGDGTHSTIMCPNGYPFSSLGQIYDYDNNGCLDMLVGVNNTSLPCAIYYFEPDHSYTVQTYSYSIGNMIDVAMEYTRTNGDKMLAGYVITAGTNSRPQAPTALRSTQNDGAVVIEWNHAEDKETPVGLMRYNISIKRKGATGAGAYLLSPLNMDNDELELPAPIRLLESNCITIPLKNIPTGEYEVKVQGVDGWHLQSKYSETYALRVLEQSIIDMPTTATVDVNISVKIGGNSTATPDFGEDAIVKDKGNGTYSVKWTSPGMKTVTVGTLAQQSIYVQEKPNGAFTLPAKVLRDAYVVLEGNNLSQGKWSVAMENGDFLPLEQSTAVEIIEMESNRKCTVVFKKEGHYELRHSVSNNDTECHYDAAVEVQAEVPAIYFVNIDNASGHYRIAWTVAESIAADVKNVIVYKETSQTGQYLVLDTVPASQLYYVDQTSAPKNLSARYKIAYELTYGESVMSETHQPIHVMIGKGVGNAYNLMWSKYEGVEVLSYRILGGETAEALQEVAVVSGNLSSYTTKENSNIKYYAVEVVQKQPAQVKKNSTKVTSALRSNVVSVEEAREITSVEEVVVLTATGLKEIDGEVDNSLQLLAYIYPVNATLRQVEWTITEGSDIASVDKYGYLTAKGNGNITVRATSVDGTDAWGEIQITSKNVSSLEDDSNSIHIINNSMPKDVFYTLTGIRVTKPQPGNIYIVNGKKIYYKP